MPQGGFKLRIRANRIDKVNINGMIQMDQLGKSAFDMMKKRVLGQQKSEDDRSLPDYNVKEYKKQERSPTKRWKDRRTGQGWDERTQGPPPDVYQQIKTLGGVIHKGADWKGGEPIYYSKSSPVVAKRGKLWGYRWSNKSAFLRSNYGGTKVDHNVSGSMWSAMRVAPKAPSKGNMQVTVGFRGAVPRMGVYSLLRKLAKERKERLDAGKKPRRVNASTKALLANSRGKDGKLTHHNPVQWLGMTDKEMGIVLSQMNEGVMKRLNDLPIEVVVR